jgi:hypothetical protein
MDMHGQNTATSEGAREQIGYQKPLRTWASHGTGATCDLCECRIHSHDIEYQVELGVDGDARTLHMHFACHQRWASEGRRRR